MIAIPHVSARPLARVVDHLVAHERAAADRVYDPVGSPALLAPLLVEAAFDPASFADAVFFDLFDGMAAEPERAINGLFRVYIDGMLSPSHENELLYDRPRAGETFAGYLQRAVGDRPFGIVVNGAEQWSDPLARLAARTFAPVVDAAGRDRTTLEVTLFIGNYGYTPFGIHIDDPFTTVVHFHVGPSAKVMTLFDKQTFHRLNGERKHCFEPDRLIAHGERFAIQPGDLFVLPPHHYHVGHTPGFSIGIAVAISKYPPAAITKHVLARAASRDGLDIPFDELVASSEADAELFAAWLRRQRDEALGQARSRGNLRYAYGRRNPTTAGLDAALQPDPDFPIVPAELGKDLLVFVRGNRIRLARTPLTSRLVESLTGGPLSVSELHRRLQGEISLDAVQGIVHQLTRFHGLHVEPAAAFTGGAA